MSSQDESAASVRSAHVSGRYALLGALLAAIAFVVGALIGQRAQNSGRVVIAGIASAPVHDPEDQRTISELRLSMADMAKRLNEAEVARSKAEDKAAELVKRETVPAIQPVARHESNSLPHVRIKLLPLSRKMRPCRDAAMASLNLLGFKCTFNVRDSTAMGIRGPYKATVACYTNPRVAVIALAHPEIEGLANLHDKLTAEFGDSLRK